MNCSAPRGTGQLKSLPASVVNAEIYVTGSNSKFLSKDVATEFRGRGDEIHMYPLSFGEFLTAYGLLYVSAENHLPGHKLRTLKLLQRTELRDTPGLLLRQVQNIKDALLSPSDMMRKAGELAKVTLCNTYAVREKQLEKDLAHKRAAEQDPGVLLSISFYTFDLEQVRRDKQVLVEAFGEEMFQ